MERKHEAFTKSNDPEKIARLPEGTKNICVGRNVAEAVYQKFFELASRGMIKV